MWKQKSTHLTKRQLKGVIVIAMSETTTATAPPPTEQRSLAERGFGERVSGDEKLNKSVNLGPAGLKRWWRSLPLAGKAAAIAAGVALAAVGLEVSGAADVPGIDLGGTEPTPKSPPPADAVPIDQLDKLPFPHDAWGRPL